MKKNLKFLVLSPESEATAGKDLYFSDKDFLNSLITSSFLSATLILSSLTTSLKSNSPET